MNTQMEQSAKPRKRRVVIQRKVSSGEYEEHKAKMETLGLDPTKDSAPPSTSLGGALRASKGAVSTGDFGVGSGERTAAAGGEKYGQTMLTSSSLNAQNAMTVKEAEARINKGQKQVSLQKRTIEEQIQHGRHERALDKFKKQQHHWEDFRQQASQRTGRYKEELVVTRAEEHRERKEVMELLERATPEEVLSGGHSWYHSLRGEGTRFVTVGNMFSGLHLPIKTHHENYVHEIVRKPHLQELHVHHQRLREKGQAGRTWRDDEYLQARMRKYWKKMQDHTPGQLDMDELLEPTCIGLRPPEDFGSGEGGGGECEEGQAEEVLAMDGDMSVIEQTMSTEFEENVLSPKSPALREGPYVQVLPEKLQFDTPVNKLNTQCITLRNTGTAVIQYEWVLNEPQHGFQESILPDDPTQRFSCSRTKGMVVPGNETKTLFMFQSSIPGTFTSTWRLQTYPELLELVDEVAMHGMATEVDLLLERRVAFQKDMFKEQVLHQVQEIIGDVFETVKLQPEPPTDLNAPLIQERLFEQSNQELGLYWSPQCWQGLTDIGSSIARLKSTTGAESSATGTHLKAESSVQESQDVSQEVAQVGRGQRPIKKKRGPYGVAQKDLHTLEGVPSVKRLEDELRMVVAAKDSEAAKEKSEVAVELNRVVRAAKVQPLERSPLWWLAYETVMDVIKAVPTSYATARKGCELEPLPFLRPLEEDAAPEVIEEYEKQKQERDTKRGDEEKEAEVTTTFVDAFTNDHFGPQVAKFESIAHETSFLTEMHRVAPKTLLERFGPYMGRHNSESVEINANVVLYEVDLEFLTSFVHTKPAEEGALNPPMPEFNLSAEGEEAVRQQFQGIPALLEVSPLAVIVFAHVGRPSPEQEQMKRKSMVQVQGEGEDGLSEFDVAPGMKSLPTLEPIAELLASATEGFASNVEFVPHKRWIGEAADFAAQVRADTSDNKVFLLENMAAIPEQLGIKRFLPAQHGEGEQVMDTTRVNAVELSWAEREAWSRKVLKEVNPDVFVQDSFSGVCGINTLSCGLWPEAPQRVVGQLIEGEVNGFCDALQLKFGKGKETRPPSPTSGDVRIPAPLIIVLGGGGYGAPDGETALIRKLQLFLGLAQLAEYENDGLSIALGGELVVAVLACFLGVKLGTLGFRPSDLVLAAIKDTLRDVLALGVMVLLPPDLVAHKLAPPKPVEPVEVVEPDPKAKGKAAPKGKAAAAPKVEELPPEDEKAADEEPIDDMQTFSLSAAFAALAKEPISLGYVQGKECFTSLNPEKGGLTFTVGRPEVPQSEPDKRQKPHSKHAPPPDPEEEDKAPEGPPLEVVPEGWAVRDIGDKTCEALRLCLRRSRGVLWNGALGYVEEERFQKGTRTFLSHCGYRISGGGEDDDDEVGAVDDDVVEDEEEEEEADEAKAAKEDKEPEVEFETSLVIGRDSARMLPALYDTPAPFTFESKSGETLLQILRGKPLPGLLACAEKNKA